MTTPPLFPPSEEGFDDARRRATRRRHRRRTAYAGAAGAAAVVVAIAVVGGGGGLSSLTEQPAAPGHRTPSSPSTPGPGSTNPALAAGPTSPLESPGAASARPPGVVPSPTGVGPTPGAPVISTPATRRTRGYDTTHPCADSSGRAATGWCVQFAGPFEGRPGTPTELDLALCRLPGLPTGQASFPSTREVTFTLFTTGSTPRPLWSSAHQHPGRPGRHVLSVPSGSCLDWTLTWWNRDDTGADLRLGGYSLDVAVNADNVSEPAAVVHQQYAYQESQP